MAEPSGDTSGEVTVSLRPAEQSTPAGEETTFELTVAGADRGISAFESGVLVEEGARISALELTGDPAVPVAEIVEDDTAAVLGAAMGPESDHDGGETIVVAALTVVGEVAGVSADVTVDEDTEIAPVGDSVERYTVDECTGATLTVTGDGTERNG